MFYVKRALILFAILWAGYITYMTSFPIQKVHGGWRAGQVPCHYTNTTTSNVSRVYYYGDPEFAAYYQKGSTVVTRMAFDHGATGSNVYWSGIRIYPSSGGNATFISHKEVDCPDGFYVNGIFLVRDYWSTGDVIAPGVRCCPLYQ